MVKDKNDRVRMVFEFNFSILICRFLKIIKIGDWYWD